MVFDQNEYKIDLVNKLVPCSDDIKVSALLKYNDGILTVEYEVVEKELRRVILNDNDKVYTDSCCELFIGNKDSYVNFELSASTAMLIGKGKDRYERILFPLDIVKRVKRSIKVIEETECKVHYILTMEIRLEDFDINIDNNLSFNLYKCGDLLKEPHYLTAFPITNGKVDYHQSQFFAPLALS